MFMRPKLMAQRRYMERSFMEISRSAPYSSTPERIPPYRISRDTPPSISQRGADIRKSSPY